MIKSEKYIVCRCLQHTNAPQAFLTCVICSGTFIDHKIDLSIGFEVIRYVSPFSANIVSKCPEEKREFLLRKQPYKEKRMQKQYFVFNKNVIWSIRPWRINNILRLSFYREIVSHLIRLALKVLYLKFIFQLIFFFFLQRNFQISQWITFNVSTMVTPDIRS